MAFDSTLDIFAAGALFTACIGAWFLAAPLSLRPRLYLRFAAILFSALAASVEEAMMASTAAGAMICSHSGHCGALRCATLRTHCSTHGRQARPLQLVRSHGLSTCTPDTAQRSHAGLAGGAGSSEGGAEGATRSVARG